MDPELVVVIGCSQARSVAKELPFLLNGSTMEDLEINGRKA